MTIDNFLMTIDEMNRPDLQALRGWPSDAALGPVAAHDDDAEARSAVLESIAAGRQQATDIMNDVLRCMTRKYQARRSLRRLQSLDDHVLRDIGVSRGEVVGGLCGIDFEYGSSRHDSN